jgi:cysteine desulfurase
METCRRLEEQRGFERLILKVNPDGRLLTNQFANLSWDAVRLATVILAHNETGVIQDVAPLAERCQKHGVPLHIDAVQAVGKIPVRFDRLGCTSLALGAHKVHGPRGIGALLLKEGAEPAPLMHGGHQESGRRPGTEPVALAAGMATALELWERDWQDRTRRMREMRDRLESALKAGCDPVVVNGATADRLPNTLNIAFPGCDGEALLVNLDLEGVCCSIGSTCASGSTEPAPALVAMGVPEEVYSASIRFSLSFETTAEEIEEAARRITAVVTRLRQVAG